MSRSVEQHIAECLGLISASLMRVDFENGQVLRTFKTSLYTYERPVGTLGRNGYVYISMGARRSVYGHRLIWAAAHGDLDPNLVINHKNGVKHDNRLANLEQVTPAENTQHAYHIGLIPSGDLHYSCKLPAEKVEQARAMLAADVSQKEIAQLLGVSPALIHQVATGKGRFA